MKLFNLLFTQNPMMAETRRFLLRYFGWQRGPTQMAILALVGVTYLALLYLFMAAQNIEPQVIVGGQIVVYCLVLPAMQHGSIAGEREKRTWETLLAAPVTRGQIVAGKILGPWLIVVAIALLTVPLWYLARELTSHSWVVESHSPGRIVKAELIIVTFGFALASWCAFVSARSRRAFTALGVIFASLIVCLVVWPIALDGVVDRDTYDFEPTYQTLTMLHPGVVASSVFDTDWRYEPVPLPDPSRLAGLNIALNLGLAALLLAWTRATMGFVESDVGFTKRGNHASG